MQRFHTHETGAAVDDRIDLGLVPVVYRLTLIALLCLAGRRWHLAEPLEHDLVGVTCRDDDGRVQLITVRELHAGNSLVTDEQLGDDRRRLGPATGGGEAGGNRIGQRTASALGSAGADQMARCVAECGHAGARCLWGHAPDRGTGTDGRQHHVPIVEVTREHVERAHTAPLEQRGHAFGSATDRRLRHRCQRGPAACHVQNELGDRHRFVQIMLIGLDLIRVRNAQAIECLLLIGEEEPRRRLIMKHVQIAGLRFKITQSIPRQLEIVDDRHRSYEGVIAVADIEPSAERVDGRGTTTYGVASFDQQRVVTGAGEIRRADQTVVATPDNDDFGIH